LDSWHTAAIHQAVSNRALSAEVIDRIDDGAVWNVSAVRSIRSVGTVGFVGGDGIVQGLTGSVADHDVALSTI
jgi:hypothetical protein